MKLITLQKEMWELSQIGETFKLDLKVESLDTDEIYLCEFVLTLDAWPWRQCRYLERVLTFGIVDKFFDHRITWVNDITV